MDGIQAAILSTKLPHLERWTEQRRAHATTYRKMLAETGLQLQFVPEHGRHVYHLFTVQVPDRDSALAKLHAGGVNVAVQYPQALPLLTAYQHLGYSAADFPVSASLAAHVLSLPIYPELTESQIVHVARSLVAAIRA
jgi:dTDP-4-amino-4,6-dideoxygalactose transaminase